MAKPSGRFTKLFIFLFFTALNVAGLVVIYLVLETGKPPRLLRSPARRATYGRAVANPFSGRNSSTRGPAHS